jgi:hypothetical protein
MKRNLCLAWLVAIVTLASVAVPARSMARAAAASAPCRCPFDFEDGTTQSWAVTWGSGLAVRNNATVAFTGTRSLAITVKGAGAVDVENGAVLSGLTNSVTVTYHLYAPRTGAVSVQPFAKDRSWVVNFTAAVTLAKGWNTLTSQVPYQPGVNAIGLGITPLRGWTGRIELDAVAWPDSFVRRAATRLQVQGQDYRFDGLNIYNANSVNNCWYTMGNNGLLDQTLSDLAGLEVFRSWFFQSLATTAGGRDWSAFDHTLQVAAAHHVKVVVTLANQWGDCETTGYKNLAWYRGGYSQAQGGELASYRAWVQEVVTRYRNDPTVAMWQLMNEAEASDARGAICQETAAANGLRAFTDDVGGLAHSLDANHLVNLGTIGSGQCGATYTDYEYVHASPGTDLCEYHDYGSPSTPLPGDQWNGLQLKLTQCNTDLDKPLFVGETGISVPDEATSASQRATDFDAKLNTQFAAKVVGEMPWTWNINCSTNCSNYDIGVGDPTTSLLTRY